jgi:hypothetical protein
MLCGFAVINETAGKCPPVWRILPFDEDYGLANADDYISSGDWVSVSRDKMTTLGARNAFLHESTPEKSHGEGIRGKKELYQLFREEDVSGRFCLIQGG